MAKGEWASRRSKCPAEFGIASNCRIRAAAPIESSVGTELPSYQRGSRASSWFVRLFGNAQFVRIRGAFPSRFGPRGNGAPLRISAAKANARLRSLADIQTVTPPVERDKLDAQNPLPYKTPYRL